MRIFFDSTLMNFKYVNIFYYSKNDYTIKTKKVFLSKM